MNDVFEAKLLEFIDDYLNSLLDQNNKDHYLNSKKSIKARIMAVFKEAGIEAPPIPDEVLELRQLLGIESDRGCVLAAVAYLETELARLLQKVLIEDKKLFKELFEGSGPLATFFSKIELAYGLGHLSPFVRRDLHLIRKIRNIFAHHAGDITFDNEDIAARCAELYNDVFDDKLSPRKKFIRVAMGVAAPIHVCIRKAKRPNKATDVDKNDPETKARLAIIRSSLEEKRKG